MWSATKKENIGPNLGPWTVSDVMWHACFFLVPGFEFSIRGTLAIISSMSLVIPGQYMEARARALHFSMPKGRSCTFLSTSALIEKGITTLSHKYSMFSNMKLIMDSPTLPNAWFRTLTVCWPAFLDGSLQSRESFILFGRLLQLCQPHLPHW